MAFDTFLRDYPALNRELVERLSGLVVRYDGSSEGQSGDDPRIGLRVPDLALGGSGTPGPDRLFQTTKPGKFTLLDLTGSDLEAEKAVAAEGVETLVQVVSASPDQESGADESVETKAWTQDKAVLIRPDGHAAWIGDRPGDAVDALKRLLY